MRTNTPVEINALPENKAVIITVQRITEVINRRRKTRPFEGDEAAAAVSDIRAKIAGAGWIANSQLFGGIHLTVARRDIFWQMFCVRTARLGS